MSAALAPIVKTRFARRITRGGNGMTEHKECWGAVTTDGVWEFDREDSPGTPWLIFHRPSVDDGSYVLPVEMCGSLRACRVSVAAGYAAKELAKRQAEAEAKSVARGCVPACRWPFGEHQEACPPVVAEVA